MSVLYGRAGQAVLSQGVGRVAYAREPRNKYHLCELRKQILTEGIMTEREITGLNYFLRRVSGFY